MITVCISRVWKGHRKRVVMIHREPVFFDGSRREMSIMTPLFTVVISVM